MPSQQTPPEHLSTDDITGFLADLDGVLTVRPRPGDGSPPIGWGDTYFFYAPDGVMPTNTQPFATIVTKNYPGDERSRLDRPGTYRVNIAAGKEAFTHWTGHPARDPSASDDPGATDPDATDPARTDTVIAHPVYGTLGWLAVVDPGPRTATPVRELLRHAYRLARSRAERRADGHRLAGS